MLDRFVEWVGRAMEVLGSEVLNLENGYAWILVGLVLVLLESLGAALFCASLGVAALLTGVLAFPGWLGLPWLLVIFGALSIVVFLATRPLVSRITGAKGRRTETNVHGLIGRSAVVGAEIRDGHHPGTVRIAGDEWRSLPVQDGPLPAGTKVYVWRVEGATLRVHTEPPAGAKEEA